MAFSTIALDTDQDPRGLTSDDAEFLYISRRVRESTTLCHGCAEEIVGRLAAAAAIAAAACVPRAPALTRDPAALESLRASYPGVVAEVEGRVRLRALHDPIWRHAQLARWIDLLADQNEAPFLWQTKLWCALAGRYTLVDLAEGRGLDEFARHHATRLKGAAIASMWPMYHGGHNGGEVGGHGSNDTTVDDHGFVCQCPEPLWRVGGECTMIRCRMDGHPCRGFRLWCWFADEIHTVLTRYRFLVDAEPNGYDLDIIGSTRALWATPKVNEELADLVEAGEATKNAVESWLRATIDGASAAAEREQEG